ncbi:MAG: polymerase subunit gamma and tau [Dehalococcoidia bacterium]|nr:polymerase subunit gamma and tau [Dehalococcoidia bacterium]
MSQVLYRKWRPQTLAEVVGQDHVTRTLKQAVLQGRIAHAYLFCGPRGTGKTSTARILAKAVNCLKPSEGEPCNQCPPCKAANEGRSLDLVEIDAASHRGIEEMRSLREKVHFVPAESRYKVYIVDEVHMMTPDAFNAFLKTLEEPPPHAIFVLATTEAHKVLPTIISRCQRFDFHRISHQHIETRLARICQGEGIKAEPQALNAIARSATGSLRDAENLLEQLVVSYDSDITLSRVRELLGLGDDELALELARHILKGETREGLKTINAVADQGLDLRRFHRQVVDHLRGALLLKAGAGDALEHTPETVEAMKATADSSTLAHILKAVRLFGQATPRQDGSPTLPLELALLDCTLEAEPVHQSAPTAAVTNSRTEARPPVRRPDNIGMPQRARTDTPPRKQPVSPRAEAPTPPAPARETASPGRSPQPEQESPGKGLPEAQWNAIRLALKRFKPQKLNIGSLLLDCGAPYVEGESLVLVFKTRANMERMQGEMENPETRRFLQETVQRVAGTSYALRLSLADQGKTSAGTPKGHLVRAARAMGADIIEGPEEEKSPNE